MSEDRQLSQTEVHRVMVMKLYLSGKRPSEIAQDTGLAETTIKTYLREANELVSFEMLELAETSSLRNLARMEQLFSVVWPYALGQVKNKETGEVDHYPPDEKMAKLALQIIKMEEDQSSAVQEAKRKQLEEERAYDEIIVSERTFTGSSELYQMALEDMRQEYLVAGEESFVDFDMDRLYNQDPDAPLGDERLDELRAKLPGIDEDYEREQRAEAERDEE